MPAQEQAFLTQEALLWSFTQPDQHGEPLTSSIPTVLSPKNRPSNGVRWNSKKRIVTDPEGNTISLDATAIVTGPITINSQIWLGTLNYWNENKPDQEVMIVKYYNETKDIKGRVSLREIGMMRKHNI